MKLLPTVFGIALGIVIAVPAHAETGVDEAAVDDNNEVFLADLHAVGISFQDPGQAITAGKSVCGLISRGVSGLQLLNDLKANNPALTTSGAAQFATISAKSYCPKQLEEGTSGKG
ncbi:hypothetical protein AWC29_17675 [Mycobacterium triplex]|uniref:DUF732 domain-containing protein n=1 Tax=Mycobacterium triplex TaxID=47839 RepID=A0A024JU35_9MYCO|nr:DUF732 domain-containing protein [Mycobacterium triplex]ORX03877.1 hypothetical protein AWC29_17675 [Mycobacterium triplex]CDO86887.1 hypothetical protein BN973_01234 [Mycobacterium triplex]